MTRALAIAALVCATGTAAADCPPKATGPVKVHVTRDGNGTRVVIDTPIDVCGRPPAPAVAYVAPALDIEYRWAEVQLDFLPLIIASVRKQPFEVAK